MPQPSKTSSSEPISQSNTDTGTPRNPDSSIQNQSDDSVDTILGSTDSVQNNSNVSIEGIRNTILPDISNVIGRDHINISSEDVINAAPSCAVTSHMHSSSQDDDKTSSEITTEPTEQLPELSGIGNVPVQVGQNRLTTSKLLLMLIYSLHLGVP